MTTTTQSKATTGLAAIFFDYENLYGHVRSLTPDAPTNGHLTALIKNMGDGLEDRLWSRVVIQRAYADFEVLPDAQGGLFLIGVDAINVPGTHRKNAADMRLTVDVMEILYEKPEVTTFIIVSGDRDYIPVITHLRKAGKDVRVVAFPSTLAGDLRTVIGNQQLFDATEFLPKPDATGEHLSLGQRQTRLLERATFPSAVSTLDDVIQLMLTLMTSYYIQAKGHREIWLGPFKKKFAEDHPTLAQHEIQRAIDGIIRRKMVHLERRPGSIPATGEPHEYAVLIPDWENPVFNGLDA